MTKEQFETKYADNSGVTVEFLHAHGREGRPCDCDDPSCEGWQMAHLEPVSTPRSKRIPEGHHRQPSSSDSIPRWRTEDIDEHVQKKLAGYEAAFGLLEGVITGLREQVNRLAVENERLKWELVRPVLAPPRDTRREELMSPPVVMRGWPDPLLVMEGTNIDE